VHGRRELHGAHWRAALRRQRQPLQGVRLTAQAT
jgi:hypothetical protein